MGGLDAVIAGEVSGSRISTGRSSRVTSRPCRRITWRSARFISSRMLPGQAWAASSLAAAGWTAGADTDSHDVYFGSGLPLGPGDFQGNQAATGFDPGPLDYATTYYWRVDEVNGDGTTEGRAASVDPSCNDGGTPSGPELIYRFTATNSGLIDAQVNPLFADYSMRFLFEALDGSHEHICDRRQNNLGLVRREDLGAELGEPLLGHIIENRVMQAALLDRIDAAPPLQLVQDFSRSGVELLLLHE